METAIFGAGCFWGVEKSFFGLDGVVTTRVGYSGGNTKSPSYEDVCSGDTGHAEVLKIEYDPEKITYEKLLEIFWKIHDPTTLNRQGLDIGDQYRSVVFYSNEEQKLSAENSKASEEASGRHNASIVTSIEPAREFWDAEEYHQQYFKKRMGLI